MSGVKALENIYSFAHYLGLIDKIPNIKNLQKNVEYFVGIQNAGYDILKSPIANVQKAKLIKDMDIFTDQQVKYIIKNQSQITYPFDKVKNNKKDKNLMFQQGGFEIPSYNITNFKDMLETLQNKFKLPFTKETLMGMLAKFGITPQIVKILANLRPGDFKGIVETFGFKLPEGPEIKITDWIFFPLWSLENLPLAGPFMGVPIDFMSVMIAQLDIVLGALIDTLDNLRGPAIQAASSAFGAVTVGVGLAATPILVPIINRFFDVIIHIVGHLGTILNMFINISRKNFGLAYVLFCEIVPIFETFMNIIINYMVILNRFLNRSGRFLDIYVVFLTNLERIIYLTHPKNLLKIKDEILEKIQNRINEKIKID